MKLAEALLERKDILKRLEVLRERLVSDGKVQEGDRPARPPRNFWPKPRAYAGVRRIW